MMLMLMEMVVEVMEMVVEVMMLVMLMMVMMMVMLILSVVMVMVVLVVMVEMTMVVARALSVLRADSPKCALSHQPLAGCRRLPGAAARLPATLVRAVEDGTTAGHLGEGGAANAGDGFVHLQDDDDDDDDDDDGDGANDEQLRNMWEAARD